MASNQLGKKTKQEANDLKCRKKTCVNLEENAISKIHMCTINSKDDSKGQKYVLEQ